MATVEFTATRLLVPQLRELQRRGFEVQLACRPDSAEFSDELRPFAPATVRFSRSGSPLDMIRGTADLLRLVHARRPAIVHLHSPATALPARVGLMLPRLHAKVVYTVHGFAQTWDEMTRRDRVLDTAEKVLSNVTDMLLFQSKEDLDAASRRGYHGRLVYLGNGVQDEWFSPNESVRRRVLGENLRVAYVGRMVREKGVLELLQAVLDVKGVELTMIGAALESDRDDVTAEARRLAAQAPDRVHLVGMLPGVEVRRLLHEQDCFVLPSYREGVPRSMIEAMACALPVIGTDIRGSRELVRDGVHGWIVPARSADAVAGALRQARDLDPEALRALGRAARDRAWAEFRESLVYDRLEAAYAELGVHRPPVIA